MHAAATQRDSFRLIYYVEWVWAGTGCIYLLKQMNGNKGKPREEDGVDDAEKEKTKSNKSRRRKVGVCVCAVAH